MFQWLFSLFGKKHKQDQGLGDTLEFYKPKERIIYSYWNGSQIVKADPMTLYKRVMDHSQELSAEMKVSNSPSKDASSSHTSLVKKVRDIFNVLPLEEGGLSELETLQLLDHFMTYTNAVKKN